MTPTPALIRVDVKPQTKANYAYVCASSFRPLLNHHPSGPRVGFEVDTMLKAHLSSRGRLALPKQVRDQLGLGEGDCLSVLVEGDEVILRKAVTGNWREWEGRFKGSGLLGDLARNRRIELANDGSRS